MSLPGFLVMKWAKPPQTISSTTLFLGFKLSRKLMAGLKSPNKNENILSREFSLELQYQFPNFTHFDTPD